MIATTWATGSTYLFTVRVTKISNEAVGTHTYDFSPRENRNVNLNSYTYASDIVDDYFLNPSLLPLSGITIPACSTASTQRLYVPDKIIFDLEDYCIYNHVGDGAVIMGPGAELIVEDGSTLSLNDALIKSCDTMWKGIYVKKGGRLILNDCVIENAQYGIRAERGAQIASYGTTFKNIYIGFYISPIAYQSDPEDPDDSYVLMEGFYNNLFIGTGEMLPPYSGQSPAPNALPYAGIKASHVSVFDLPGNVAGNDNANYFENLSNGILLDHASFRMMDAFFRHIHYDPEIQIKIQGYGVYVSDGKYVEINGNTLGVSPPDYDFHFEDCDVAIFSNKGAVNISGITMGNVGTGIHLEHIKNQKITIDDNEIYAHSTGILLNQCVATTGNVTNNTVEVSGDGDASACIEINDPPVPTLWNVENNYITVGDARFGILNRAGSQNSFMNNTILVQPYTEDDAFGIYLEGIKGSQATCNYLTGDIEPEEHNYHNSAGIFFEGNNPFNISCNDITDFRYGIRASSQNTGLGELRGNTFGDLWQGLHLGSTAIIGPQDHNGNIWDGTYYDFGAVHEGQTQLLIQMSRFLCDTSDNDNFLPDSIYASFPWFYTLKGISFACDTAEVCPEGIGYSVPLVTWDSLDLEIISGNLGLEYFNNPLTWMSRFHTYRRLKNLSSTLLPSQINTFLSNQSTLNIGKFSNAYDSLSISLRYTGPLDGILEAFPDDMAGFYSRIQHWDTLIMADRGNDSLINRLKLVYDSIYILECNFLSKNTMIGNVLNAHLENAITYVEAINPDSSWEEQLQFTLLELLDYARNDSLTSSEDLNELAMACPDMYGDPVYHARSLIRIDSMNRYYDNQSLCSYLSPRQEQILPDLTYRILPNPASESVTIIASNDIHLIRMYDLAGRNLPVKYDLAGEKATLDLLTLHQGVYIIHLSDANGNTSSQKMVIARP